MRQIRKAYWTITWAEKCCNGYGEWNSCNHHRNGLACSVKFEGTNLLLGTLNNIICVINFVSCQAEFRINDFFLWNWTIHNNNFDLYMVLMALWRKREGVHARQSTTGIRNAVFLYWSWGELLYHRLLRIEFGEQNTTRNALIFWR